MKQCYIFWEIVGPDVVTDNIYSPADMPEVTLVVAKFFNFEKKVTHFFTCKYSSQSLFII